MDHNEAIRLMAAEQYVLNELTPELRRSFEEHFFQCAECEFDVQSGYALIDGSKQVFSAPPAVEAVKVVRPSRWAAWLRPAFAVPVMAVLLMVVAYQNFVTIPVMKNTIAAVQAPHVLNPVYLTAGVARGSAIQITTRRNAPISLTVDVPTESRFSSYLCELQSSSGESEGSVAVSAEAAKNSVSLSFYARHGNSGTYQLIVLGVSQDGTQKTEIERQSFELQTQD